MEGCAQEKSALEGRKLVKSQERAPRGLGLDPEEVVIEAALGRCRGHGQRGSKGSLCDRHVAREVQEVKGGRTDREANGAACQDASCKDRSRRDPHQHR